MNAGVLNEKGRIFSPHPPLSSERRRTEEFWDDLIVICYEARACLKLTG
ncbi:hypothetical protein [Methanofollis formosanus]|nr:hypothetical protein [Methanofollis formosanus]